MTLSTLLGLALCVLPGLASAQDNGGELIFTVNGTPVQRQQIRDRLWQEYGETVIGETIQDILVDQAARQLKLKPDMAQVEARLKRIEAQFPDAKTFQQKLEASGGSLEALRDQLTKQVLREQLVVTAKKLSVSDAEARAFFEANKDKFGSPAETHLRHILVATEKEANDFMLALRAGADFGRLASQVSQDKATKDQGGDLGWVSNGMLQPQFQELVRAVKPGDIGGPIRTPQGFELVKVEATRPPKPAVYKDVEKDLKQALLADKINKAWPEYLGELRAKATIAGPRRQGAQPAQ